MKRNICLITALILILCLGLCACGSSSEVQSADTASESTADDTIAKADELIAQEKYEEALDVLTSDSLYQDSKKLSDIRNRINTIEKLTNGETKPANNESRSTKEIKLTKDNFWNYFEARQVYVLDPFNHPYMYSDVIVIKEEYADKIAYDEDFKFAIRWLYYGSCSNYYEINPETLEMTFLRTKFSDTYKSDSFSTYKSAYGYFDNAQYLDYSIFDGSPIAYDDFDSSYFLDMSYSSLSHNYDDDDNVYSVHVSTREIEDIIGSIILYQ